MKKILSLLMILSLSLCSLIVSAQDETSDPAFEKADGFLRAVGAYENNEMNAEQTVTRAEFSQMLTDMLGLSQDEAEKKDDSALNTSFLNEKGWLWLSDSNDDNGVIDQSATKYSDVSAEFKEWNSIKIVDGLGFLTGNAGKFRPYENITGMEAVTAMVKVLNADRSIADKTSAAYMVEAHRLKLLENLTKQEYTKPVRYRDITVLMYNSMHAKPYVLSSIENDEAQYVVKNNYYLMSYLYNIYINKGTVSANEYANFDGYALTKKGYINVNGMEHLISADTDALFGCYVKLYYKDDDEKQYPVVYYELMKDKYEAITVDADDIQSFSSHTIRFSQDDKTKSVKILSTAAVVYNGVLITDYQDSQMVPKSGSVELIDINKDGSYEVVKIWKYDTLIADTVDYDNKIIYGSKGDINSLSLKTDKYQVYLANGTEVVFSTVSKDSVLSIASTVPAQGIQRHKLIISPKRVSGKVTGMQWGEDEISIDNITYKVSHIFERNHISLGSNTTVFLDYRGRVVKAQNYLLTASKYGYLRNIKKAGSELSETYGVRLFESNNKFKDYLLENRVIFNGSSIEAKDMYKALTDVKGITKYQVVQYWVNTGGNVDELCTSDGKDGAFCKMDTTVLAGNQLTHRNGGLLSYANNGFAAFLNTTDGFTYFAIPSDRTNELKYGCIKTLGHEQKYSFDELYIKNKESKFVDVLVQLDADAPAEFIDNNAQSYMMISKINRIFKDDTVGYAITGYDISAAVNYKCFDENILPVCETLNVGDIIRVMTDSISGEITYVKRFYNAEKCAMENGTTVSGDILHPYEAYNGFAVRDTDSQQFLILHRYNYVNKVPDMTTPYVASAERTVKYPSRIIRFNKGNNMVYIGNKLDIICSTNASIASQVVVCSYYENAQIVFVIG